MRRKVQQSLFDQLPKRGRKPLRPHGHFGGSYLSGYNPNCKRPMDSKKALHVVLRSSRATKEKSFKSKNYEARIWDIISAQAKTKGVTIYSYANGSNHLHLLLRAKNRADYSSFIRAITGLIARLVGGSERGRPLKKRFWDGRPYSRVVTFAKNEFKNVRAYLLRNVLEAIGWIPYYNRNLRLPLELKQGILLTI